MAGQNSGSGEKNRILAAIIRRPDGAWFFKMVGDDALGGNKSQRSWNIEIILIPWRGQWRSDAGRTVATVHPPIGNIPPAAAAAPASNEGKPEWQVPRGWKEIDGGQFLSRSSS